MATIERPKDEASDYPVESAPAAVASTCETAGETTPNEPLEYLFWGINEFYLAP